MSANTSRLAYQDCFTLFERANEEPLGIKFRCESDNFATYFRARLNKARTIDREDNALAYDSDHPMHGRSVYDDISISVRNGAAGTWIIMQKISSRKFEIVSLTEEDDLL
jgi:hypothetical protein